MRPFMNHALALLLLALTVTALPLRAQEPAILTVGPRNLELPPWDIAVADLNEALAEAANRSGPVEIWVAAGTYVPTADTGPQARASFALRNNVALYGGFAGSETRRSQRNLAGNPTILSGNDARYHVVTATNVDAGAILDGFTIRDGNATGSGFDGTGGGMYIDGGNPTLRNLIFTDNYAIFGGGLYVNNSATPTLENVLFENNEADDQGGGMINRASNPVLTSVTFRRNTAPLGGGGLFNFRASSPTLNNVVFENNDTNTDGGGLYNDPDSNPVLNDVTFANNRADQGGGMYNAENNRSQLNNVMFSANQAITAGAGMYNTGAGTPTLTDVTFEANMAVNPESPTDDSFGGGMANFGTSAPTLTRVDFIMNEARTGGGMHNAEASTPRINQVLFRENSAADGGGINNDTSAPELVDVQFIRNRANNGGGIDSSNDSDFSLNRVSFAGNRAADANGNLNGDGGAVRLGSGNISMVNVLFSGNAANRGGALYVTNGSPVLVQASFSGNQAVSAGGGIYAGQDATADIFNSILWGNSSGESTIADQQISRNSNAGFSLVSSIAQGILGADPLFLAVPDPGLDGSWGSTDDDYGNLRLQTGSPAIDSGDNNALPTGSERDRDGNPRIIDLLGGGAIVDMGAYESGIGALQLSSANLSLSAGEVLSYSVSLERRPFADVTIALSADSRLRIQPQSLTFTPENWDQPQDVEVQLSSAPTPGAAGIEHSSSSNDPAYSELAPVSISVSIDTGPPDSSTTVYLPLIVTN